MPRGATRQPHLAAAMHSLQPRRSIMLLGQQRAGAYTSPQRLDADTRILGPQETAAVDVSTRQANDQHRVLASSLPALQCRLPREVRAEGGLDLASSIVLLPLRHLAPQLFGGAHSLAGALGSKDWGQIAA